MKNYFTAALLACTALAAYANDDIERIFSVVNSPDKPALAVVALKDGRVVYEKAFGSANLEYKIPASPDTRFQVDKLAWEFIAYATLALEGKGKIKLDDDVRKYLPDLPDFGDKITITHLLSSTDGLHGYKVLKSLAGWESREPEPDKAILQLAGKQKALNFKPGTAFSPGGDTRLVLLSKVVEAVTGQAFDAYCKAEIFAPLGMSNTQFVSDSSLPLMNTAVPYRDAGNGAYKIDFAAGPINLYTSVRDLAIWRAHLSSHASAGKLNSPIRLDDGAIVKDISSITNFGQQHLGQERGIPKMYQFGLAGGYASSVFRFPAQNFEVVTLSSGLAYSGSFGMRLAHVLLKGHFPEPENIDYSKVKAVKLGLDQLRKHEGDYWNPVRAISAKVNLKDGVLYFSRAEGVEGRELIPLGDGVFQVKIEGDDTFMVRFSGGKLYHSMDGSDPVVYEAYKPSAYTKDGLAQFEGTFYSEELNSSFVVKSNGGGLSANNVRVGTVTFKARDADRFSGDKRFLAGIQFIRGQKQEVTGFRVQVDEVRTLVFRKI